MYSSNPWESNHMDGPTGHKKDVHVYMRVLGCSRGYRIN